MQRAAAGETFDVTRRGKPYVRLSPAEGANLSFALDRTAEAMASELFFVPADLEFDDAPCEPVDHNGDERQR